MSIIAPETDKQGNNELSAVLTFGGEGTLRSVLHDIMGIYTDVSNKDIFSHLDPLVEFDDTLLTPKAIKEKLDEVVISQEDAKKVLSVALWTHLLRIRARKTCSSVKKSNILLVGPSGSGKTYIVQQLAKIINIPFFVADATQITQAGFVGKDADYCVEGLFAAADGDIERTQYGILFIDEVDKISTRHGTDRQSDSNLATQQSLLKLIEGTDVILMTDRSSGTKVCIDTSNILIIFGGAFTDITDEQTEKQSMGFTRSNASPVATSKEVTTDNLITYGLIPELVGRISVVSRLQKLTLDDMVNILMKTKENVVDGYKTLLEHSGIHLEVSQKALFEVAKMADGKRTGARALTGIFDRVMTEKLFAQSSQSRIMVDEEDVRQFGAQH